MSGQLDLLSGEHLRDEGAARVDAHTPDEWKAAADATIEGLAELCRAGLREYFTAEDVRAEVGDPPNHFNAMGARFLAAVRRGVIQRVGETTATRSAAHATRLRLYTAGDNL